MAAVVPSSAGFAYVTQRPSVKSAFEGTIHYFVVIQLDLTLQFVQNPIIYLESDLKISRDKRWSNARVKQSRRFSPVIDLIKITAGTWQRESGQAFIGAWYVRYALRVAAGRGVGRISERAFRRMPSCRQNGKQCRQSADVVSESPGLEVPGSTGVSAGVGPRPSLVYVLSVLAGRPRAV